MKFRVYVETSVISYLTGRPSRDPTVLAHQQLTQQWWNEGRSDYELYISEYVTAEASQGDPDAARQRMAALDGLPEIATNSEWKCWPACYIANPNNNCMLQPTHQG